MLMTTVKKMADLGIISYLDYHFFLFFQRKNPDADDLTAFIALLVSHQLQKGHVCLSLEQSEFDPIDILFAEALQERKKLTSEIETVKSACIQFLEKQRVTDWSNVGTHWFSTDQLLVQEFNRVYLNRYYHYEKSLADWLDIKARQPNKVTPAAIQDILNQLFEAGTGVNYQKRATAIAIRQQLCVITGGPGTGKTYAVTRLLAALNYLHDHAATPLIIKVAAPTGKAAARLNESIRQEKQNLHIDAAIKDLIPEQASTIHRLLGTIPGKTTFRFHRKNRLLADVLIVDEASMIDLSLMSKLVEALPDHAKLVLLGDKDQLSSVAAGSVFGDICKLMEAHYSTEQVDYLNQVTGELHADSADSVLPVADCLCQLKDSRRFDNKSAIGQLAKCVNESDANGVLTLIRRSRTETNDTIQYTEKLEELIEIAVAEYTSYANALTTNLPATAILERFNQFRVLCALRAGPYGVSTLNEQIEHRLFGHALAQNGANKWYVGRPVMVTKNDYSVALFNGDVGITLTDQDGNIRVFFADADLQMRTISPTRMPECETAFAMTIHKSQGSEFHHVAVVLPDMDSKVLTKELLYTGITRAKSKVTLQIGSQKHQYSTLITTLNRATQRSSGLFDRMTKNQQYGLLGSNDIYGNTKH